MEHLKICYHGNDCKMEKEADTQKMVHPLNICKIGKFEMAREYAERLKEINIKFL